MYTSVQNATRTTSRHAYDILEGKTCMQIMWFHRECQNLYPSTSNV